MELVVIAIIFGMIFLALGLPHFLSKGKNELENEPVNHKEKLEKNLAIEEMERKTELINEWTSGLVKELVNLSEDELNIIRLIVKNSRITQDKIAEILHLSKSSVKRNIAQLKEKEMIARVGADKNGYWKILK